MIQSSPKWATSTSNITHNQATMTLKKHNNRGLGVGNWSESEKMSGHAILKNLYEKKMDVILTISFKITAEIEIRRHIFCVLLRGVSALYSICFSFIHCHEMPSHCVFFSFFFFTVNNSVNAARSSLNHVYRRKFDGKGIKFIKTFRLGYVISLNVAV